MIVRLTVLIPALFIVLCATLALACTTTTATPTPSPSPTISLADTPVPIQTHAPSPIPTDSPTPVPPTATYTHTPTYTATPSHTFTPTPTVAATDTPTSVPTDTPSPVPPTATYTHTPIPTYTFTPTPTYTPLPTDTPIPTPTYTPSPTYTPTYTPTFTPTLSPTSTYTPTQTPTVTPTPTSTDTPTPTNTPTITPTPVVLYGVNWIIGGGVSEKHETDARLAAGLLHDYAVSMGVSEIDDITAYVYHDFDKLIEVYSDVSGRSESRSREIWDDGVIRGLAGRDSIFINTSRGSSFSANRMLLLTAHELSHAQRHGLHELRAGFFYDDVPEHGPRWLDEGISDFHEYQVLSLTGSYTYDFAREYFLGRADFHGSLRDMEAQNGFVQSSPYYPFFAAELLASIAGESSLYDFYAALHPGTTWQAEFKNTFGLSIGEFYDRFEEHEAAGFPKLEIPKFVER